MQDDPDDVCAPSSTTDETSPGDKVHVPKHMPDMDATGVVKVEFHVPTEESTEEKDDGGDDGAGDDGGDTDTEDEDTDTEDEDTDSEDEN